MNQRPRLSGGCYITLVLEVLILMPDKTGKYLKYVLSVQYHWSKNLGCALARLCSLDHSGHMVCRENSYIILTLEIPLLTTSLPHATTEYQAVCAIRPQSSMGAQFTNFARNVNSPSVMGKFSI